MNLKLVIVTVALVCAGCAVKTAARIPAKERAALESHEMRVCILTGPLPETLTGKPLGKIVASKLVYGGSAELMKPIADEARKIGADVVTNITTHQRIGGLVWVRPTGEGLAIKLTDRAALDCVKEGGKWL